jgi:hypothetical protein
VEWARVEEDIQGVFLPVTPVTTRMNTAFFEGSTRYKPVTGRYKVTKRVVIFLGEKREEGDNLVEIFGVASKGFI